MYLKSIEILGFKSFADKTHVDLNPGITGVVGPNGCGKSNIMESVRWCLGEMSWKSLRSESMVSIIFGGTARRAPLSMAEVTLTFDNAQSLLPVQYSEVSVTRRLFRSGESEYFINRVQVRLRDVREMFLDTGIGSDGYAIIDQGGVDFVMRAKPEERRALFEEAAGVSKYKAKREEALRKLDKVQYDLERLGDQIRLSEERIKKLDADARKARLYQKYKQELVEAQVGQILHDIGLAASEIARETEALQPTRQRHGELVTQADAEEGRLAALSLEKTKKQDELGQATQKIGLANGAVDLLKSQLESQERERLQNQGWLREGGQELEAERSRAAESEPRIAEARQKVEGAAAQREKAAEERRAFEAQLTAAAGRAQSAETEIEGLRRAVQEALEREMAAGNDLRKVETALGQTEYYLNDNIKLHARESDEARSAREQAGRLRSALDERRGKADAARAEAQRLEGALTEARLILEGMGQETLRLRGEEADLTVKVRSLEAQGSRDAYWVGAQAVVGAGLPGVLGTVQSLLKVEEAHRALLEDALGERLHAVVCDDLAAAAAGVQFLKDSRRGRARFFVLSSFSDASAPAALPPQVQPLLSFVRFDPAHERLMNWLLAESYSDQGALFGPHWLCGGSAETEGETLKLSDLAPARERLSGVGGQLAALASGREAAAVEATAAEGRLVQARDALSREQDALRASENELHQQEQLVALMEKSLKDLEARAVELRAQGEEARKRSEGLAAELERLRGETARARAAEEESARKAAGLREELLVLKTRQENFDEKLETLKGQENFLKTHLVQLEESRASLLRGIESRLQNHAKWEERLKELQRLDAEAQEAIAQRRAELGVLQNAARALQDQVHAMSQDAQGLEESLRLKRSERDRLREAIAQGDVRISGHKAKQELLTQDLSEKYSLSVEEAREKRKDQPFDPERMLFLQRRIDDLGNINMAAPEEYEALVKEKDSLQFQVTDLNEAKGNLFTAIQKINATTRENFRQTFSEVRDHFRRLYGILFEGGESDLVLTDQENMLETGVEILAQPPGKKLQSISQLSGGEKTLTAIALLFSFFMVKPSPICMLDEADAALDDANVDRFVSMLRQFADKSQFLIVSHSKKTMEACDVMYGVTMEESGVSQIISVDFRRGEGGPEPDAVPSGRAAASDGPYALASSGEAPAALPDANRAAE
ncbi:MAG TPA: chromosome segregation protein SMC [Elusimicrobia bacterium]|nr:chromosome segregation protein SMC [Elusimicrobiota bacterium]